MKKFTAQELVKFAKIQDIEPELYKLSACEISEIKETIEKVIDQKKDDYIFSILMRLKSHVMVCEDWICLQEKRRMQCLCS